MNALKLSSAVFALLASSLISHASLAFAQGAALSIEGISGDVDKHHRAPFLSVRTLLVDTGVKILADGESPNQDYKKYPVRFDFFVNRRLFSSQLRSPELPGAVGVDIGSDIATTPFNYTVVATVLHPNRSFTSVIQGAVYGTQLGATLKCTLTSGADGDAPVAYAAEDVNIAQTGNNTISLSFKGSEDADGKTSDVSASLTIDGETATGSVNYTEAGNSKAMIMSGSATMSSNALSAFSLSSVDSSVELVCE